MAKATGPARDPPLRVLYDDQCRVCRAFARALGRLDGSGRFDVVGFDEAVQRGLHATIPPDEFYSSFHALGAGLRWSGAEAVPRVVERLPAGRLLVQVLRKLPGAGPFNRTIYGWIARNRGRLGCVRELAAACP